MYFKNTEINASITELENMTSIYPNPFTTALTIESDFNIERVDIFSVTGQLVKSIDKPNGSLDLSELEPGMYLFNAFSNGEIISSNMLKKL
jgi:hypothetical protein